MFVHEQVEVAVPVTVARQRLLALLGNDGLSRVSDAAVADGGDALLKAGIGMLTKTVHVQWLPPYTRGDTTVLAFSWFATGQFGELFPALDANLEVQAVDPATTRLTLAGSYRPPIGHLGRALDDAILHRVAIATISSVLGQISAGVLGHPEALWRHSPAHSAPAPDQPAGAARHPCPSPGLGGLTDPNPA